MNVLATNLALNRQYYLWKPFWSKYHLQPIGLNYLKDRQDPIHHYLAQIFSLLPLLLPNYLEQDNAFLKELGSLASRILNHSHVDKHNRPIF